MLNAPPTYFVVQSDFETESPGWRFWKWFNKGRLVSAGAGIIFPGKNDLVVDTVLMTEFASNTVFPVGNLHEMSNLDLNIAKRFLYSTIIR
jgi:hypothetical protein